MNDTVLTDCKEGSKVEILEIKCGFELSRRLNDLSLFAGAKLKVLKNDGFGPIIVKALNSKIALGRGEAAKIHVTE